MVEASRLSGHQAFLPTLDTCRHDALQQCRQGFQRFSGFADRIVKSFPVIAVLSVVVGDHMLEMPCLLQLAVSAGSPPLDVLEICRGKFALLAARPAQ